MNPNHIALNLATKGLLNISNITKGMLIILQYVIVTKKGGSPPYIQKEDYRYYNNEQELYQDIRRNEDIDYIKVFVNWDKSKKDNILVEAILLKKKIETELLTETGKNINVEIIN